MSPLLALINPVISVLKGVGIIKDSESEAKAMSALLAAQGEFAKVEKDLIESVNSTMREEAKSEHWAQWLWRPMVGFTFCATIVNNYILLPYLVGYGLRPIGIPGEIWSAMLVVLGVAAGTRGWEKIQRTK
jgi:hypothetical protein